MNSFSAVVRALEVEFARQCAVLDAGGRDRAADDALGCDDGAGAAGAVEGGKPRLPVLPGSRPSAAGRAARTRSSGSDASFPSCRRRARARFATCIRRSPAYDIDVLTSSRALGDYFEQVARRAAIPKPRRTG